ncbi:MAG: fatty acid desaturase, partial [Pirellulaceae bacterium]
LTVFRFLILGPLAWFIPPLRRLAHNRLSSLVIDPTYIRPPPSKARLRSIYLQEFLCFLWCCFLPIFAIRTFGGLLPFLLQAYFTGVVLLFINGLRTLGAHRWLNTGQRMTFVEQLLDSVNYPKHRWISGLWGPVGSRYHALHHLFPTMPYHNLSAAHRALMKQLPEDSPYRRTSARSLTGSLLQLYRRAAANGRRAGASAGTENSL